MSWDQTAEQEIFLFQKDVEYQLREEEDKAESWKQSLDRANFLTNQVVSVLDSFDQRIRDLSTTMGPIHDLTQRLTITTQNIDSTVHDLKKIIGYIDLPLELRQAIRTGSIGEDIDAYLAKVDKLAEGINYLVRSKLKSGEKAIAQLRVLQREAQGRLEQEFRILLEKASRAIDPLTLYNEEKNAVEEPPKIDPELMTQLKKISAFLQESPAFREESDHSEIIIDVRTVYLRKSFELLAREKVVLDRIKKKQLKNTDFYEKGSHSFLFYAFTLLAMLNAEKKFIESLVIPSMVKAVFENIFEPSISMFVESGEAIIMKVKRKLLNLDFSDVFIIFDLLENLNKKLEHFEALTVFAGVPANEVIELISSFKHVATDSFHLFMDELKTGKQSQLPVDGTVHELTSNTLNHLARVYDYKETIESLLQGSTFGGIGDRITQLSSTGKYFMSTVDYLRTNLEQKSKNYKKPTLTTIFLLNNYHYIQKTVLNSSLNDVIGKEIEPRYKELISAMSDDYQATWKKAIEYLLEINAGRSSKLAPQKIKEKFTGFNSEFEELYKMQQQYSIPDRELRVKIRRNIIDLIVPLYNKFLERYKDSNFTKHPEKYIKYESTQLERMLNEFFGVGS